MSVDSRTAATRISRHAGPVTCAVLIVDDHAGFRAQARPLLEADGFVVVGEAADGASALTAARELGPDVVLLDVQLPDIDGFEVASQLSAYASVVLISSREAADYGSLVHACGACGFIPKAELSGPRLRALLAPA
jgi:DNA-binding NarL/FixJ family response regulator